MRRFLFTILVLLGGLGWLSAQVFTDFESNQNAVFNGWPNAPVQVMNPDASGINLSDSVGCWARGGEQWAHCYSDLTSDIDFASNKIFEMKVYAPIACTVLFKLEDTGGTPPVEVSQSVVAANTWEQLSFDFSFAQTGVYDKIIIFFDFATFGTDTFYFDDISLVPPVGPVLSQIDLPVTFEDVTVNYSVTDFGGNTTVLGIDPLNAANNVAITTKDSLAQTWAGTTIGTPAGFASIIPFSATDTKMSMKVYSPAIGLTLRLKVEDHTNPAISCETDMLTTAVGAWEVIEFDFSNEVTGTAALNLSNAYDMANVFFDFGNIGNGDVFYWDDVEFMAGPPPALTQIDLPVTFEDSTVDYTVTDFGGNTTVLGIDPLNAANNVAVTTKDSLAQLWAGTTIGTPAGFANAIPFAANASSMQVMVYSPDAGIPVRLKVEDAANAAISVETEATTTMANAWDTLVFDFSNPVIGTAAMNLANTYDKASIFFNFGTDGTTAGNKTYYWDDVAFLPPDTNGPVITNSQFCETYTTHFGIPGEVASAIYLTITNVDATSMFVEIESASVDPVDLLLVLGGSGASISDPDTTVQGKIKRTLTWTVPPADVSLNLLWSKQTFGGNWQLNQTDIVVPFAASCVLVPPPLSQMDLPVTFDDTTVNYATIDFGGTNSQFVSDPTGGTNEVVETTKTAGAQTWAGTTLATQGPPEEGFANAIPFTASETQMTVRVYSPSAGIPVMLKLEDESNAGIFVEAQDTTTAVNSWETLTFDYSAATSGSLNLSNTYDKATIFFNFGTGGSGGVYYWDDVEFVDTVIVVNPAYTIFNDFDANENEVFTGWPNAPLKVANPDPSGINVSDSVGCWARGGEQWAHAYSDLLTPIDFSTYQSIEAKVYSPIACTVLCKLESTLGAPPLEVSQNISTSNTWENLSFNFTGAASGVYNKLIFFFDFSTFGTDTFYFDDVQLAAVSLAQIDLPVDFESMTVDYSLTDFGGASTMLGVDPMVPTNNVAITTKTAGAQTWAGTTIGTASGFATAIPFTTLDTKLGVKVYSPAAGIPILLKVEDHNNGGIFCEVQSSTTMANAWETIEFDYATGTPALNLSLTYDMASIFFDFGSMGAGDMFYWDDVEFIVGPPPVLTQMDLPVTFDDVTVNYATIDFGGTNSQFVADPTGGTNQVVETTKTAGAQTWAGTTLATQGPPEEGFANAIPFTANKTQMTVRVYSPSAGIPVMLKLEDESNAGIFVEAQDTTTAVNTWETLTFDYSAPTNGSLNLSSTYDKAIIFFNFGAGGSGGVYYWDDVEFVDTVIVVNPAYTIFNDFDANENEVFTGWPNAPLKVANPDPSGVNVSDSVGCWARGGEQWAHAYSDLLTPIDFSTYQSIEAKVYSPIACTVLCKLESTLGAPPVEVSQNITAPNTWQNLSFNFTGAASGVYNKLIFFFDFATFGTDTFYFDDVQLAAATLAQIDLPVDFESLIVDYSLTDFGGASTMLGADPMVPTNNVAITTKTAGAQTWAGTTIGTASGFATAIPFTTLDTKLSVNVYSPAAGIPILLKVEDHSNNAIFCEVQSSTTMANAWETIEFDYATGTPALNLSLTYDMASIFFDFGSMGAGDMFYWDEVQLVPFMFDPIDLPIDFESALIDYTFEVWGGTASELVVDPVDTTNHVAKTTKPAGAQTWAGTAPVGNANGLANAIPFTSALTKMSVRIYSPAAGIPVLLKVEDKNNGAQACETLGTTTVANAWETIVFDFANEQPGTPALNLAWTYNKVAIFFDFGNMGAGDIFYWDDVQFLNYSIDIQTVSIVSGWSIISTYIDPFEASLDSVFAPVLTEVVIVKDWNGLVFWPQFGLNAIGSLTIGGGYQAKFVTAQNLDVTGTALVPENTPVSIPAGWSIIGYLRNTPGNAEVMFSTIVSDLTIAKNGSGLVYWPFFGLNAIGNLIPGEGYQLKLVNGVTLYYPANGPVSLAKQSNITCNYYTHSINTGDNMTVAFPIASWNVIPNMGDEIGAFNADGSLIGSAVFTNNHTVLTIWGNSIHHLDDDGAESGEQVHFRLYSSDNNRETEIEIDRWESGDDIYKTNEIAIAGNASYMEDLMTAIAYPNPAKETLTVQLTSANANVIDLKIFNAVGVLIENQRTENKPGDDVLIQINTSEYTSGSYYFTVNAGTSVYMDRFQVIK